ncbi:MAG: alanine--tRNA ligase [Planctomycetota bacterium]
MATVMTAAELRDAYIGFFEAKGCTRHPSAPLITDDPTTLFTVAGMAQFKDMFLGRGTLPFSRATTCQKCMRTNDILNVGRTPRHHTFFEMLGNFSFDDYFKRETIAWAWEFLTQVLDLDAERLWVSVHTIDDEAWDIWSREIGFPEARMVRLGDDDNFWPAGAPAHGPLGPGGCCSEIFWDFEPDGPDGVHPGNDPGDRFVEIWNLVFPQFNVCEPKVDGRYRLDDLGRRNIDTGAGLERMACVLQGKRNNFDTDLFQAIIARVCEVTDARYVEGAASGSPEEERNALVRRIADHVRGVTFAIADGAQPTNTGAGYVVRRLIRRAVLDVDKLGLEDPCLHGVVGSVVAAMGAAYPEIVRREDMAAALIEREEKQFRSTLRRGLDLLERELATREPGPAFDGDKAFRLYETYGFPREVTEEILDERELRIDEDGWQRAEEAHRAVSRSKDVVVFTASALSDAKPRLGPTTFIGYDRSCDDVELVLLEVDGAAVDVAEAGTAVRFALAPTPFYAEGGGQVADHGQVLGPDGSFTIQVTDVQRDEGLVIHSGVVEHGSARPGPVYAAVDQDRRGDTAAHHTATHLLHQALCAVLGDQVEQQGSKVDPGELRFDFNHPQQLTREQLNRIEQMVGDWIIQALEVQVAVLPIDQARARGAKALFGEKYGDEVRAVAVGDPPVSVELCGGCHVANTAAVKQFRILREEASAAGIRRIIAIAGDVAVARAEEEDRLALACGKVLGLVDPDPRELTDLAQVLKARPEELEPRLRALVDEAHALDEQVASNDTTQLLLQGGLVDRVQGLQAHVKRLRKQCQQLHAKQAMAQVDGILAAAQEVAGVPLLVGQFTGVDGKGLREVGKALQDQRPEAAVILGSETDGKAALLALVPPALHPRGLQAGALIGALARQVGGGGGGRPDQAQAGGRDGHKVGAALAAVPALVAAALGTEAERT